MQYCVYHHKIGTEIVYVGVGGEKRPYQKEFRTSRWHSLVKDQSPEVVIVKWFDSRNEAETFEKQEIKRLSPKGNYQNSRERSVAVNVPVSAYQKLRQASFERHMPLTDIIGEIIHSFFAAKDV